MKDTTYEKIIDQLQYQIHKEQVDKELLLDYITHLELMHKGKIINGRLPFYDDDAYIYVEDYPKEVQKKYFE